MSENFLTTFLNIALTPTINLVNGFIIQPLTKLATGTFFSNSSFPVNYVNSSNQYQIGNAYTNNTTLSKPTFTPAPAYNPGSTTPPISYPTTQQSGYSVPMGTNTASMYQFSAEGLRMLKVWEGLHQRPYQIGTQAYIGYGHRISSLTAMPYVSIDQANSLLTSDISTITSTVQGAISVKITQGQFDAMVDFAYTISSSKFSGSDVITMLNSSNIPGACTALAQWVYVLQNNMLVKVPHLVNRRSVEIFWMTAPTTIRPPS
jgi:lysozyme